MMTFEERYGIAPWEPKQLTVCIAAICDQGNGIVIAADKEVGLGVTSTVLPDGKFHRLFPDYIDWSVGIAGTVFNATDVIGAARRLGETAPSYAAYDVRTIIEKAYSQTRRAAIEAKFLAGRGWTLDEFKNTGAQKLPPATYAQIDAQLAGYDQSAELIVAGFGPDREAPAIFTLRNPGIATDNSKLGFWCIGSGATAAQMSLFSREYSWGIHAEEAAYYVYEAKRHAEKAAGVGMETNIFLLRRGYQPIQIRPQTERKLKSTFDKLQPRKFTKAHMDVLLACDEFKRFRNPPGGALSALPS